jgi:hypothetical protein
VNRLTSRVARLADVPGDDPALVDAERLPAERGDQRRVEHHDLGLPANLDTPPGLTGGIGRFGLVIHDERNSRVGLNVAELLAAVEHRAANVDGARSAGQPQGYRMVLRRTIRPDGRQAPKRMPGQVRVLGIGEDHLASLHAQPRLRSTPSCG